MKRRIISIDVDAGRPYWEGNKALWNSFGQPDGAEARYNAAMKYAETCERVRVSVIASRNARCSRERNTPHRDACVKNMRFSRHRSQTFKEWLSVASSESGNGVVTITTSQTAGRFHVFSEEQDLDQKVNFGSDTLHDWWRAAGKQ